MSTTQRLTTATRREIAERVERQFRTHAVEHGAAAFVDWSESEADGIARSLKLDDVRLIQADEMAAYVTGEPKTTLVYEERPLSVRDRLKRFWR